MTDLALMATGIDPDVSASLAIYERIKPLKDALGIGNLTDGEMQVFALVARYTGLDPFTKQIYAIKRGGKVTHQTGIDGYRSTAERTHEYAGSDEATYEDCACGSDDSPPDHPKIARVTVRRILANGHTVEQVGVARWHELKPAHTKSQNGYGYQDDMWWRQPYNQLAKCAEANGLRKAFPRVLGGVYITEEMQGADTIEGEAREVVDKPAPVTVADRIAARRAEREAPAIVVDPAPQEAATEAPVVEQVAETASVSEADEAQAGPVDSRDAGPAETPGAAVDGRCGNASPFGDGGSCGLPADHTGKLHRELGIEGVVVGSWPTT